MSVGRDLSSPGLKVSVREYVFYVFSDFNKRDYLRFFEMTCDKVIKSR